MFFKLVFLAHFVGKIDMVELAEHLNYVLPAGIWVLFDVLIGQHKIGIFITGLLKSIASGFSDPEICTLFL